jgi:hypothetical protein
MVRQIEQAIGQELPRRETPGVAPYVEREQRGSVRGREKVRRRLR